MKKIALPLFLIVFSLFYSSVLISKAKAVDNVPLGVHILTTEELSKARQLTEVRTGDERWTYVTIPFTLSDVGQTERWQKFFNEAKDLKVIPLVRLATRPENDKWVAPNYHDVVSQIEFLSKLDWPTHQKHIIIFNEVNHAKEWGGSIDPAEYARIFEFASSWARSESANFVVLPAAMDLAAPNGPVTKEAFAYLDAMLQENPEILSYADAWNSHSYPNPGFAASPERTGKNSLRGFIYELEYLKNKTGQDYKVYITETGWETNSRLVRLLPSYYTYALQNIWNHPQVVAVTPFLLKGSPGPFAGFSFFTDSNQPTPHYFAMRSAIDKVYFEPEPDHLSSKNQLKPNL